MSSQRKNGQDQPQVEDPNEFNQRRRLKEIADTQTQARQTLMEAEAGYIREETTSPAKAALSAVRVYAQQLMWLIVENGGDEYFTEHLGDVVIHPPDSLKKAADPQHFESVYYDGNEIERVLEPDKVEPHTYPVIGLVPPHGRDIDRPNASAFVQLPAVRTETWDVRVKIRHKGPTKKTFSVEKEMPLSISSRAFDLCNKFLNESGLDARIETETDVDPNPF